MYDPYPYYGPNWGVGVGVGVSHRVDAYPYRRYPYDPFCYDYVVPPPRFLAVYDEGDAYYWDWHDEGEARVVLTFRRAEKEFRHELLFRRVKM